MSKKKTKAAQEASAAAREAQEGFVAPPFTITRIIEQLGKNGPMSMKALMEATQRSDRDNFVRASIWPSLRHGYIQLLYKKTARHPFQKYLLTKKGEEYYNNHMA